MGWFIIIISLSSTRTPLFRRLSFRSNKLSQNSTRNVKVEALYISSSTFQHFYAVYGYRKMTLCLPNALRSKLVLLKQQHTQSERYRPQAICQTNATACCHPLTLDSDQRNALSTTTTPTQFSKLPSRFRQLWLLRLTQGSY